MNILILPGNQPVERTDLGMRVNENLISDCDTETFFLLKKELHFIYCVH